MLTSGRDAVFILALYPSRKPWLMPASPESPRPICVSFLMSPFGGLLGRRQSFLFSLWTPPESAQEVQIERLFSHHLQKHHEVYSEKNTTSQYEPEKGGQPLAVKEL